MDIQWFRDLVICISGLVVTGVLVLMAVLAYSLYRRTKSVLVSVETVSRTVEEITTYLAEEVIKPVSQMITLVQGIRQGIDAISKLFKKQEGGENG